MTMIAILLAAGRGARMGKGIPKQYRLLAGRTVLRHSLEKLIGGDLSADKVVVVIRPEHKALYLQVTETLRNREQLLPVVDGGETRQQSVYAALQAIAPLKPKNVIIHDAARPLANSALFMAVRDCLKDAKGAICAYPISDTLKHVSRGKIDATIDRAGLYAAQTPQAFDFETLWAAHEAARKESRDGFTDDAALLEWGGEQVILVESTQDNLKLTTQADWKRAELLLRPASMRSAIGFDVHAFCEGDHVMLGGIRIPHGKGVKAHSDGDVVLHALTDAVFGILGEGDIGTHFPPSDPKWKNAKSEIFLAYALARLDERGGRLTHCDVTILAEAPRLDAHRKPICENLARLTNLSSAAIGLKATTAEGLGFIGRSEGLAAFVNITASLPDLP